jgi:hypothetical protein
MVATFETDIEKNDVIMGKVRILLQEMEGLTGDKY